FTARGTMGIKNMLVAMAGYPEVLIRDASFLFTPAYTSMDKLDILVAGTSDFLLKGNVGNYIPYVFRNETLKGNLSLASSKVDVTSIMNAMATDTTAVVEEDTAALAVIAVPRNIDFDFNAQISSLIYDNIKAENLRGHIIVRDGILSLRETGMSVVGGTIKMNADYDTRDTLKPVVKADFEMKNIGIKDAFNTFVTVQKFAPAAKGLDGRVNLQMKYESLLGSDMMPVIKSINGYGKLQSDQVQVLEAPAFDKMKEILKLGDNYTNTFKDINVSFRISEGRVYVNPFDVKMGTIRMNISGDQGLDQTLNYLVKTEIPRAALGSSVNALMDNLTAQASALGIAYKPSDVIKVNVRVRGVVGKPEVSPDFGSGGEGAGGGVKETVKETVKQTVTETVDKGKEALRKEAEEQGDKLIREAEARGQQLRDEADKAAIKLKEEAEAEAAKLISAAEPKGALAKAAARKAADALVKEAERKGTQLRTEADKQAIKLVDEAKAKKEEMIARIQ
ncbi:MAG TPA: AsmA-like C-terminal region-containing protein, partial [Bacteroidales bacterium]|nr:AsmA-like C-terminal region-containing protein [Bacteroidales bacterium]